MIDQGLAEELVCGKSELFLCQGIADQDAALAVMEHDDGFFPNCGPFPSGSRLQPKRTPSNRDRAAIIIPRLFIDSLLRLFLLDNSRAKPPSVLRRIKKAMLLYLEKPPFELKE